MHRDHFQRSEVDGFLRKRSTWKKATEGKEDRVLVKCPKCGGCGLLKVHEVSASGDVTPSYGCPWKPCDYHAFLHLEDWSG